jgi:hypothetical protein
MQNPVIFVREIEEFGFQTFNLLLEKLLDLVHKEHGNLFHLELP